MNRRESRQCESRRKNCFRPIMLTSKAMKPLDRDAEGRRKYDRKMKSKFKFLSSMNETIKKQHLTFINESREELVNKLTEQYKQQLIRNMQNEEEDAGESSRVAPSIVKLEFTIKEFPPRAHTRYNHPLFISEEGDSKIFQKIMNSTNTKTYDAFVQPGKIKTKSSNGLTNVMKKEQNKYQEEWRKYLHKHYINIKKINKGKVNKISEEKMMEISRKVEQYQKSLQDKFQNKYRSNSVMMYQKNKMKNSSKTIEKEDQVGGKDKGQNSRIEEDMLMKRSQGKKDHFVFGLSGSPSKGGGEVKGKFEAFKDFLWKVNFSNGLYVRIPDELDSPYKVFVGRGNNSLLVKGIIRRRPWWQLVDKITDDTNFVWTQLKVNDFFALQKKYDKRQKKLKHRAVRSSFQTNKDQNKQETQKEGKISLQIPEQDPNSRIMKGQDYQLWMNHYQIHKEAEDKLEGHLKKRIKTLVRKKQLSYIGEANKKKLQNHMPCNYFLGNKKALFYLMRKYYQLQDKNPFDYLPVTFHIVKGEEDPEYQRFLQYYTMLEEKREKKELQNIWIMKPGELSNQGKGISICSSLDDVKLRLRGRQRSGGKLRTFILQKYIERPLLYNKRKFDIRHFMVMSCVGGRMKGYWHGEGYLRTSSSEYSGRNPKDLLTHLTNDAVQQAHPDYGRFERANKLSYADFHKYLLHTTRGRCHFHHLLPTMQAIGRDCMRAAYARLAPRRQDCFELFGLDFMVDEELRVRLIEANTNPCLDTSCPLLSRVVAGLLENLLKLCVDPIFPPPHDWPAQRKFQLGDSLADNRFTLIFDEACPTDTLPVIDLDHKMGDIEEEDQEFDDEGNEFVED